MLIYVAGQDALKVVLFSRTRRRFVSVLLASPLTHTTPLNAWTLMSAPRECAVNPALIPLAVLSAPAMSVTSWTTTSARASRVKIYVTVKTVARPASAMDAASAVTPYKAVFVSLGGQELTARLMWMNVRKTHVFVLLIRNVRTQMEAIAAIA